MRSADGLPEETTGSGARLPLPRLPRARHDARILALPRASRRAGDLLARWGAPKWPPTFLSEGATPPRSPRPTFGAPRLRRGAPLVSESLRHGRGRLQQPRPPHVSLDVTHDVALHDDLGLVVLDVPVRDRRQQAGHAPPPRHDALAAIDQRAALGLVERLALLDGSAAQVEHLLVGRRSRDDPRECLAVEHHARLARDLLLAPPPEADAPGPALAEPLGERAQQDAADIARREDGG